jgi:hypothetical protein
VHLKDVTLIDIATIDLSPYQSTPQLPTEGTLTLSQDLLRAKPPNGPPQVEKAAARLALAVKETQQALIGRVEDAGLDLGSEVAFDGVMDHFWAATRNRLAYWMIYDSEGLDLLDEQEQIALDIVEKREKAELARELDKHLFGEDGLGFLRRPFSQQVALTASRLAFIKNSENAAAYEQLLDPELLEALTILQGRYETIMGCSAASTIQADSGSSSSSKVRSIPSPNRNRSSMIRAE